MTARVRVRLTVESGRSIAWPRIESEAELMTADSVRPMEHAARIAQELIVWLEVDCGIDRREAYQLPTHVGRMRIGKNGRPPLLGCRAPRRTFL